MSSKIFFSEIATNFLKTYWYIVLIVVFFAVILPAILKKFSPGIKGLIGEKTVASLLTNLDAKKYLIINNLLIEFEGQKSQIDHVLVSNFGIFIIETKNYNGLIFGDTDQYYWKRVNYKIKNKFLNPIKQNSQHLQNLKKILSQFPDIKFIPIVVFTERSELNVRTSLDVVYSNDLISTIKKYQTEIISDDIKEKIFSYLNKINLTDKISRKDHICKVKENILKTDDKIIKNICPMCGSNLVIRKGKYGEFKGYSNFPKCKFTIGV